MKKFPKSKTNLSSRQKVKIKKLQIKQQMGANKGKTARAVSRHAAAQGIANSIANAEGKKSYQFSATVSYNGPKQNGTNTDKDKDKESQSSNILGWLN